MPWTLAHPAFTIPFLPFFRRPFAATCLIIGSIAPDFPYFIFIRLVGWGHELPWNFIFGIPSTLLASYIWMRFLCPALLINSPLASKLPPPPRIKRNDAIIGCFAAGIGIITHLIIDAFTHATGYMIDVFPSLQKEWIIFNQTTPLWHLLQYVFTAVGIVFIFLFLFKNTSWHIIHPWRMSTKAKSFWFISIFVACLVFFLILILRWPFPHITVAIISLITSFGLGMTATSIIYSLRQ